MWLAVWVDRGHSAQHLALQIGDLGRCKDAHKAPFGMRDMPLSRPTIAAAATRCIAISPALVAVSTGSESGPPKESSSATADTPQNQPIGRCTNRFRMASSSVAPIDAPTLTTSTMTTGSGAISVPVPCGTGSGRPSIIRSLVKTVVLATATTAAANKPARHTRPVGVRACRLAGAGPLFEIPCVVIAFLLDCIAPSFPIAYVRWCSSELTRTTLLAG